MINSANSVLNWSYFTETRFLLFAGIRENRHTSLSSDARTDLKNAIEIQPIHTSHDKRMVLCVAVPKDERAEAKESVSEEELLEDIAGRICQRQMASPAIFLLESLKPVNFIGSQLMLALGPLAGLIVEPSRWEQLAHALEKRSTIERLIRKIEEREREPSVRN
ncbi:MAG: hypothetical protein KatS3mg130_0006 [Candidatus Sumerlaea sp.]|nr:MAG: hypothetical protein KatS3mg130_0006 [Candidatus Sumerlaea sp.]